MSTARTTTGCMAEDYAADLSTICKVYVESKKQQAKSGHVLRPDERRRMDIAESFILAARFEFKVPYE